jgi:hypothetical protein
MQSQRLPATVSSFPALPSPSKLGERRTNKRFNSQQIKLTFLGVDHIAINWSLSGVLVEDRHPRLAIGTDVSGIMTAKGFDGNFRFSAELVRRDTRTKELAFRFVKPSGALLKVLADASGQSSADP